MRLPGAEIYSSPGSHRRADDVRAVALLNFGARASGNALGAVGSRHAVPPLLHCVYACSWNRRWFVLENTSDLYYYTSPAEATPRGRIDLTHTELFTATHSRFGDVYLELHEGLKKYALVALSSEDFTRWVTTLSTVITAVTALTTDDGKGSSAGVSAVQTARSGYEPAATTDDGSGGLLRGWQHTADTRGSSPTTVQSPSGVLFSSSVNGLLEPSLMNMTPQSLLVSPGATVGRVAVAGGHHRGVGKFSGAANGMVSGPAPVMLSSSSSSARGDGRAFFSADDSSLHAHARSISNGSVFKNGYSGGGSSTDAPARRTPTSTLARLVSDGVRSVSERNLTSAQLSHSDNPDRMRNSAATRAYDGGAHAHKTSIADASASRGGREEADYLHPALDPQLSGSEGLGDDVTADEWGHASAGRASASSPVDSRRTSPTERHAPAEAGPRHASRSPAVGPVGGVVAVDSSHNDRRHAAATTAAAAAPTVSAAAAAAAPCDDDTASKAQLQADIVLLARKLRGLLATTGTALSSAAEEAGGAQPQQQEQIAAAVDMPLHSAQAEQQQQLRQLDGHPPFARPHSPPIGVVAITTTDSSTASHATLSTSPHLAPSTSTSALRTTIAARPSASTSAESQYARQAAAVARAEASSLRSVVSDALASAHATDASISHMAANWDAERRRLTSELEATRIVMSGSAHAGSAALSVSAAATAGGSAALSASAATSSRAPTSTSVTAAAYAPSPASSSPPPPPAHMPQDDDAVTDDDGTRAQEQQQRLLSESRDRLSAALPAITAEHRSLDFATAMVDYAPVLVALFELCAEASFDDVLRRGSSGGGPAPLVTCDKLVTVMTAAGVLLHEEHENSVPLQPAFATPSVTSTSIEGGVVGDPRLSRRDVEVVFEQLAGTSSGNIIIISSGVHNTAAAASAAARGLSYAQFVAALLMVGVLKYGDTDTPFPPSSGSSSSAGCSAFRLLLAGDLAPFAVSTSLVPATMLPALAADAENIVEVAAPTARSRGSSPALASARLLSGGGDASSSAAAAYSNYASAPPSRGSSPTSTSRGRGGVSPTSTSRVSPDSLAPAGPTSTLLEPEGGEAASFLRLVQAVDSLSGSIERINRLDAGEEGGEMGWRAPAPSAYDTGDGAEYYDAVESLEPDATHGSSSLPSTGVDDSAASVAAAALGVSAARAAAAKPTTPQLPLVRLQYGGVAARSVTAMATLGFPTIASSSPSSGGGNGGSNNPPPPPSGSPSVAWPTSTSAPAPVAVGRPASALSAARSTSSTTMSPSQYYLEQLAHSSTAAGTAVRAHMTQPQQQQQQQPAHQPQSHLSGLVSASNKGLEQAGGASFRVLQHDALCAMAPFTAPVGWVSLSSPGFREVFAVDAKPLRAIFKSYAEDR